MTAIDKDNADEDSSAEFEGLHDQLTREPVSQDQADARVDALLEQHLKGKQYKRLTFMVDANLPPETVIKVEGPIVTLSVDAMAALDRHWKRTGKQIYTPKTIRKTGAPYRGS